MLYLAVHMLTISEKGGNLSLTVNISSKLELNVYFILPEYRSASPPPFTNTGQCMVAGKLEERGYLVI